MELVNIKHRFDGFGRAVEGIPATGIFCGESAARYASTACSPVSRPARGLACSV